MKYFFAFAFTFVWMSSAFSQSWVKVSAGTEFSLALKSDGTLWAWGANNYSQFGVATPSSSNVPIQVGSDTDWADVGCGAFHVIARKTNGSLWAWGYNFSGQLGLGNTATTSSPTQIGTDLDWEAIACGSYHSGAIKSDGTLWMWGNNYYGQIGNNTTTDVSAPIQIGSLQSWQQLSLGGVHSLGLRSNGGVSELCGWGFNLQGQLGLGNTTDALEPTIVAPPTTGAINWKSVSAGFQFSTAIAQNGTAWTWGFNGNGQLGQGDTQDRNVPTQLGTLVNWNQITAGSSFAYGTLTDATSFSWGFNGLGVLSIGTTQSQNIPYPLTVLSTNINSIALAAGAPSGNQLYGMHALALSSDSLSICSVGANYIGQLGNGNQNARSFLECDVASFVSIKENPSLTLAVYPNPSAGIFTIEAPLEAGQVIVLFDLNGQQVFSQEILNSGFNQSLQTKLKPGLYLLKLLNKEGAQLVSHRLVVE